MYESQSIMKVNGIAAVLNTPHALKGDRIHTLPPRKPCPAYVVDEYPACPESWMHGSDKASSYFVPVSPDRGMWFDFTANQSHKHDVAVVVSVQGVNPVTNQPLVALKDDKRYREWLSLVQHKEKCPKHQINFQQDRFCPECKYKWPAQNYIATTTGQTLWIDGFFNEDGTTRQYIITEEEMRGIAAQTIGKDRVFAIGFAFYLSKEPKPVQSLSIPISALGQPYNGDPTGKIGKGKHECDIGATWIFNGTNTTDNETYGANVETLGNISSKPSQHGAGGQSVVSNTGGLSAGPNDQDAGKLSFGPSGQSVRSNGPKVDSIMRGGVVRTASHSGKKTLTSRPKNRKVGSSQKIKATKNLEIGAGACIQQDIGIDPNSIDYWQEKPIGLIYVNYVPIEQADEIISKGKREENKEGPLSGLNVGN